MQTTNATTSTLRATTEQRIATCEIYANRRAMVGHNTVVVSTIAMERGVHVATVDGEERVVVGMFPGGMPTCYTPADAAQLEQDFNQQAERDGKAERVYRMNERQWWQHQLNGAKDLLAFLDQNGVA
jgi:hypothetical protein